MVHSEELRDIPAPWRHNPSHWRQRMSVAILAAVAAVIALYMGLYQWRIIPTVWDPLFGEGSAKVLDSDLSERIRQLIGVPDAVLGSLAYLSEVLFALAGSERRWHFRPWLVMLFGLDVIPLGIISALLVVAQGAVVGSWCFLCLITAVISLVLVVLSIDEVWSCLLYLRALRRRGITGRAFGRAFFGCPSAEAWAAGEEITRGEAASRIHAVGHVA